jgi:hypothetical protein
MQKNMTCLPADLTRQLFVTRLSRADFFTLRLVNSAHKQYIDAVLESGICWLNWLKIEFPYEPAVIKANEAKGIFLQCVTRQYTVTAAVTSALKLLGKAEIFFNALQPLFSYAAHGETGRFTRHFLSIKNDFTPLQLLSYIRQDGLTIASLAAHNGRAEVLEWIIDYVKLHCETQFPQVNYTAIFGQQPLIAAWNNGHHACVDLIIKSYPKVLAKSEWATFGELVLPAALADVELSRKIIAQFSQVNSDTKDHLETVFESVIGKIFKLRDLNLIKSIFELLTFFTQVENPQKELLALFQSNFLAICREGDVEAFEFILNLPQFTPAQILASNPLLHLQGSPAAKDMARRLIARGCQFRAPQIPMLLPIHEACNFYNQGLLDLLLEEKNQGNDIGINHRDEFGLTPLHSTTNDRDSMFVGRRETTEEQQIVFIQSLLCAGANVNERDPNGSPLLSLFIFDQMITPRVIEVLLRAFPSLASREAACHQKYYANELTPLSECVILCDIRPNNDPYIEKLFILMQFGSDPRHCLNVGNNLTRFFNFCPIENSWPLSLKEAIRFCCDFRDTVLKKPTFKDLTMLKGKHPIGFPYLAKGVIEGTLFFDNDLNQRAAAAIPHLRELLGIGKDVRFQKGYL